MITIYLKNSTSIKKISKNFFEYFCQMSAYFSMIISIHDNYIFYITFSTNYLSKL